MKCKSCGAKVARFPLKDEQGNLIVKNLFKMDLMSFIWLVVVIYLAFSYKADIETCEEIVTDPMGYCERSNACKISEERKTTDTFNFPQFDLNESEIDIG